MKIDWNNKQSLRNYFRSYQNNNRDAANEIAEKYRKAHRSELAIRNKEYRSRIALGMTLEEYRNYIKHK